MNQLQKILDDAKTMAEHQRIITTYQTTGQLDRADAIKKYKDFNSSHPEYIRDVNIQVAVCQNISPMEELSDLDIVCNLQLQLEYLNLKNLSEGMQNG